MTPQATVVLVCGYSLLLQAVAWLLDRMGARSSVRSAAWRTGNFVYHDDQDAWKCHQDQWLYPASFDPDKRVIRYQGQHAVCVRCPAKQQCSPTPGPREITRAIDPWPHSEAGRFHRGLSLCVAVIAALMPAFMLLGAKNDADVVCLLAVLGTALFSGYPLARHLWQTPSNFPEHLPQEENGVVPDGARRLPIAVRPPSGTRPGATATADAQAEAAALIDRYSVRWSGDGRRTPSTKE